MSDALNAATFAHDAAGYAAARPTYPPQLFDWLAELAPARDCAWDAGCGSGQATVPLAQRFARVLASDFAAEQIAQAPKLANVEWKVCAAESIEIVPSSLDLAIAATAVHWFDLPRFYTQLQRALKPQGVFAAFGYGAMQVDEALRDAVRRAFAPLKPYWSAGNQQVLSGYVDLPFPFDEIEAPPYTIELDWTLGEMLAYASTWSALRRYAAETGDDLLAQAGVQLEPLWSDAQRVRMPLALRVGRRIDR